MEHLGPGMQQLLVLGKSPAFLAQPENFNSTSNQQDAIVPAIWVSF